MLVYLSNLSSKVLCANRHLPILLQALTFLSARKRPIATNSHLALSLKAKSPLDNWVGVKQLNLHDNQKKKDKLSIKKNQKIY
ncbi:MAG: hypothetical protein ACTSWE_16120 [Promethearchaeota archaeon]